MSSVLMFKIIWCRGYTPGFDDYEIRTTSYDALDNEVKRVRALRAQKEMLAKAKEKAELDHIRNLLALKIEKIKAKAKKAKAKPPQ